MWIAETLAWRKVGKCECYKIGMDAAFFVTYIPSFVFDKIFVDKIKRLMTLFIALRKQKILNMEKTEIKAAFLQRTSDKVKAVLTDIDYGIIDEAIEEFSHGASSYNGGRPQNNDEWFIAINHHLILAKSTLKALIESTRKTQGNDCVINIFYRGQNYQY